MVGSLVCCLCSEYWTEIGHGLGHHIKVNLGSLVGYGSWPLYKVWTLQLPYRIWSYPPYKMWA